MTNPLQTIPNLPAAVGVTGTDQLWINQSGTDRRTSLSVLQSSVPGPPGNQGNPGGNASAIGVATVVSGLSLNTGTASTYNLFHTDGYYTAGDGGGAFYYRNTGSAQPGDLISADGVRLSLSLAQQLTFEMLGAPTVGAIFTASINGFNLTIGAVQFTNSPIVGDTLTAAGATGAVTAGTKIVSGSYPNYIVSISQNVSSCVMVSGDSYPYVAAALQLGAHGMLFTAPHTFSQCIPHKGYQVGWFGPKIYGAGGNTFPVIWHFPSGYSGIAHVPANATVTPQGDVTLSGNAPFGGASASAFDSILIQIGDGSLPAATVNNRPAIQAFVPVSWNDFQVTGADGQGWRVFGNAPSSIADKCSFTNFVIENCWADAFELAGGDGNTCTVSNGVCSTVGLSGGYPHAFLGTSLKDIQVQTCGIRCIVRRTNNLYYSLIDNNVGNDPATSPNQWGLLVASSGSDTWNNTQTFPCGVSYRTAGGGNPVELYSCYSESDSPPALFQAESGGQGLTTVYGGQLAAGLNTSVSLFNIYNQNTLAAQHGAYTNNGVYGYTHSASSSGIVGYSANNIAGFTAGPNAIAVFDTGMFGNKYGRFTSRQIAGHPWGVMAAFNLANTQVDMQYWDAEGATFGPYADNAFDWGRTDRRTKNNFSISFRPGSGAPLWTSGSGSPNSVVTAPVGSLYTDTAGGATTTFYVKETGTGNTGWVAK